MNVPRRFGLELRRFSAALQAAACLWICILPRTAWAEARVHLITVCATEDPDIGNDVMSDQAAIHQMFASNVPQPLLNQVPDIDGGNFTIEKIHATIRNLAVSPSDAIVFYYSGHGAWDREKGHWLVIGPSSSNYKSLLRSELRRWLREKGVRLVVIVTDACGNYYKAETGTRSGRSVTILPGNALGLTPRFRSLFFESSGLVDMTSSSEGESSMTISGSCSVFTNVLRYYLGDDQFRDRRFSWFELMNYLRVEVPNDFHNLWPDGVPAKKPVQFTQTPFVFELPKLAFGVRAAKEGPTGVRVTELAPEGVGKNKGVEVGDILLKIDGEPLNDEDDYCRLVDRGSARGKMTVRIKKPSGKETDLHINFAR